MRNLQDGLPALPARLLHIFDSPMTRFVDRVNRANQSIDRNKKFPANLAGKSHCDTDTIRWRRNKGNTPKSLHAKGGIERCVRSRSNSDNLNISM